MDTKSASISREDTALIGFIRQKMNVKKQKTDELTIWTGFEQFLKGISSE
jgi:hypothetical protein